MQREEQSKILPIGSKLPSFTLQDTNEENFNSEQCELEHGLLVMFSCNHCPYVKGTDETVIRLAKEFQKRGIKFIAINSNDPVAYPEDSFENMQVKVEEMNIPFQYLFDQKQEVAKQFDAACTPEAYLFDHEKRLVYHGAICDNPKYPSQVQKMYLQDAIEQLLKGEDPAPNYVHPLGCSIKWR
ncbi:MAG: thioredoxin family protein [Deltaproteobacteria bacterium]|nr:thioredoxin family protein [Deltaproteobacteria bacterium]